MRVLRLGAATGHNVTPFTEDLLNRAPREAAALAQVISIAMTRANDPGDPNGPAWSEVAADDHLQDALQTLRLRDRQGRGPPGEGFQNYIRRRLERLAAFVEREEVRVQAEENAAQSIPAVDRAEVALSFQNRIETLTANSTALRATIPGSESLVGAFTAPELEPLQREARSIRDDIQASTTLTRAEKRVLLDRWGNTAVRDLGQTTAASSRSGKDAGKWFDDLAAMFDKYWSMKGVKIGVGVAAVGAGLWWWKGRKK